jgi:outer membrane receptor for Fe3+-dicitrate
VSPNMALFATIGVLLLAMGVGVLIGRSGNRSVAGAPPAAPIVIKGGGEESATASSEGAKGGTIGGSSKKAKPKELKAEANSGKGAEEVLHTAPGVKLADPKVGIGDKCEEGTAGCKNGEFGGEFFE